MPSRWTSKDLKNYQHPNDRPDDELKVVKSKYKNVISTANNFPEVNQRSFQSKVERDRAIELCILQRAGIISELEFQPCLHITRANIQYTPDFKYMEDGREVFEEVKGKDMYPWITIRKLWRVYGLGLLRVTRRGTRGHIVMIEEIYPKK